MKRITEIGFVRNRFDEPEDASVMKAEESVIVVHNDFSEGLFRIEDSGYIDILFFMDRSEGYKLIGPVFKGEKKGIFASRNPDRPSAIGVSTVKLLERSHNEIRVTGLDALNGSPVIDIKPSDHIFTNEEQEIIRFNNMKANPRKEVMRNIRKGAYDRLLTMAAQLHGHYCPGLALGVMAGARGMVEIKAESDGMEDLLAVVETNNCFSDGIQFVTGCSFGNNALIFKDIGKMAYSLVSRKGEGIRIRLKKDAREYMDSVYPEFSSSFGRVVKGKDHSRESIADFKVHGIKKAFATLDLEFGRLFSIHPVEIDVPEYAPTHASVECANCGETAMASRMVNRENKFLCLECAGDITYQLTGSGISGYTKESD